MNASLRAGELTIETRSMKRHKTTNKETGTSSKVLLSTHVDGKPTHGDSLVAKHNWVKASNTSSAKQKLNLMGQAPRRKETSSEAGQTLRSSSRVGEVALKNLPVKRLKAEKGKKGESSYSFLATHVDGKSTSKVSSTDKHIGKKKATIGSSQFFSGNQKLNSMMKQAPEGKETSK
ncbi:hypothetical protein O6P43_027487 [Quillaja saponaria]|uniref:Uncharacterized protein n=1 Tax=Quillaja saponaria TaxID=32244 RepID=A0AAD7L4K6_QUISA|nr:hypothetical protein O6P43_027487 [Quillaja saponaria]